MGKSSGIGGQAVMEGIMMKNKDFYAVAVRKSDGEIEVKKEEYTGFIKVKALTKIPFVRGVFNFIDSMVLGMKTLTYSASFFDEEEPKKNSKKTENLENSNNSEEEKKTDWKETLMMAGTVVLALLLAIGLFMVLPYFISSFIRKVDIIKSEVALVLLEGIIRICMFIGYVFLVSFMKDIQRVFMYHGAEHKCINCIEKGLLLTPENVMKSSKEHKRCGTSFLLIVMVISIFMFMTIKVLLPLESMWANVGIRILLLPIIAGVSYEFIRLAGRSDNVIVGILSKPGLWLQKLTTREPEIDMTVVAIAAVEAVFDWKAYLAENFPEEHGNLMEEEKLPEVEKETAAAEESGEH